MSARPLDLLDLPTLYHYRAEAVSLDSTRLLTRGNPLGAAGFLSYFNPARHLYTGINQENGVTLLGGVIQNDGDAFAKLVGESSNAVYQWESKPGMLRLRNNTRAAVFAARQLGAREAKARLAEMAAKKARSYFQS